MNEAIETTKRMNLRKHCPRRKRPCTRNGYPHAIPSVWTVWTWQFKSWEAMQGLSSARLREWKQKGGDCWWICDNLFFFIQKTDTGKGCTGRGIYWIALNRATSLLVFMVCQLSLYKDGNTKGLPCLPGSAACHSWQSLFITTTHGALKSVLGFPVPSTPVISCLLSSFSCLNRHKKELSF